MLVSKILSFLPASLEWMVLFNLSAVRPLTQDTTVRQMFFLPENIELDFYSHVVLTSDGCYLASANSNKLINPYTNKQLAIANLDISLAQRFSDRLSLFAVDEADCLGMGETPPFSPVLLHLKIESGYGKAQAVFEKEPCHKHYELLQAVGVKFLGGNYQGFYYIARLENKLPVHFHAGILAHFSRTANCNLFFLRHGNIDFQLAAGLAKALNSRVNWGRQKCLQAVIELGKEVGDRSMPMICQPPPPAKSHPLGDLVPLGFLLKALNANTSDSAVIPVRQQVSKFLLDKRQGDLWSFDTNCIPTSTDSVLILQSFDNLKAVEALEMFADKKGGYVPQLWGEERKPGVMQIENANRHWCQSDYATTCLVKALRKEAKLNPKTSIDYLKEGFETRSGLYFANPYMVDWALASAISRDESAVELKQKLQTEILASINEDHSFGKYDVAMSSALAILSLASLGCRGRILKLAQLQLLKFIDAQGKLTETTPFYSTLKIDEKKISADKKLKLLFGDHQNQVIHLKGQYHGISFYKDSYKIISTSLVALALTEESDPNKYDLDLLKTTSNCHPRYQCSTHSEYIAKFALPPYLSAVEQSKERGFLVTN
jgi:hypothetical protein